MKSGETRLAQDGPSPRSHPRAIATTLSTLNAQFSRELPQAIREAAFGQAITLLRIQESAISNPKGLPTVLPVEEFTQTNARSKVSYDS